MVFESFPILNGRYLSYSEYFMLIGVGGFLILSFASFITGVLVLFICSPTFRAKHPLIKVYLPLEIDSSNQGVTIVYEFFAWASALFLSLSLIIFSMFDWVSPLCTILTSFLIFGFRLRSWCEHTSAPLHSGLYESWLAKTKRLFQLSEQRNPCVLYMLVTIITLYSILFPVLSTGMCICFYNPAIGIPLPGDASLSTWVLRFFTASEACPPGAPCYVYLTLPEDSAHYMFVNAHTAVSQTGVISVHYGTTPQELNSTVEMQAFSLDGLEKLADRLVQSALLPNLTSNTAYYFSIEYAPGQLTPVQWFMTLPEIGEGPVTFISGGDAGNTPQAYQMSQRAGEQDPMVAFVGGDVAYDDNMLTCYQAWDLFLQQWTDYLTSSTGRLVPMVLTIGNHDVGQDSMSYRNVTIGPNGPLIFAYFPQHFARDESGNVVYAVPSLESRKSYFYHHLGDAVMYSLDTAYVSDMTGEQLSWLEANLALHASIYPIKFVTYHNPLYPSQPCTDFSAIPPAIGVKYWVPIFDKYSVMVAFENHVHSFKRTNPLVCSMDSPAGTVYVGDGQWGAPPASGPWDTDTEIFVKEGVQFHVWRVDIGTNFANFTAIGLAPNSVVDNFIRYF